jgi:hypothetical protein
MRRVSARYLATLMTLILLIAPVAGAAASESCLKMVFGRFCLGGDIRPLMQAVPPPVLRQDEGSSLALVFLDGPDRTYVLAFTGRIYKVVREFGASTQLRYDETLAALSGLYGVADDRSRFPEDAVTPARRLAAIRRGEGRALHVWTPAPSWQIELSWTREWGLSLAYVATELSAARAAQVQGGL